MQKKQPNICRHLMMSISITFTDSSTLAEGMYIYTRNMTTIAGNCSNSEIPAVVRSLHANDNFARDIHVFGTATALCTMRSPKQAISIALNYLFKYMYRLKLVPFPLFTIPILKALPSHLKLISVSLYHCHFSQRCDSSKLFL